MFITSASPSGIISNLNLGLLPSWRLEIMAEVIQGDPTGRIGVGIRYVIPPTTTFAYMAAIDTRAIGGETIQIASKGLPHGEKIADKEAFIESLQMLNNAADLKKKDIENILKDAPDLVDIYYDILGGLHSGEGVRGKFLDWRWHLRPSLTGLQLTHAEVEESTSSEPENKEPKD